MKTKVLIITLLLTVAVVAVVKMLFFPSIKDAYFAMDERSLRQVPAGTIIVRPTHFAFLKEKGILRAAAPHGGNNDVWVMGRNVPLRDVMAVGYDWDQSRIVLPPDTSTRRFDFLMTGTSNQLTRFQTTIRSRLGYFGEVESRDTDVLALKIANAVLPAFTISGADEKRGVRFRPDTEKLYFTRLPLSVIINVFGRFYETPMVDKTGQTNLYSFTMDWNSKTGQSFEERTMTHEKVEQIIGVLGLKLEPDKGPQKMLVVKKAD